MVPGTLPTPMVPMTEFGGVFKSVHYDYDYGNMIYENCTLMKHVGDYDKGHSLYTIIFVPKECTLEFYETFDDDVPVMVKKLIVD